MDDRTPDTARDLNQRLDRAVPPHTTTVGSEDSDPLIRAAQHLAQGPDVVFTDAALDRIEARLYAHMESMPLRPDVHKSHRRLRWSRVALRYAVIAVLSLVLVMMTVVQASADSLPGDRLYSIKRVFEDIRLTLVSSEDEAALRVTLAERRIDEFSALLDRGQIYPATLDDAHADLTRALDLLDGGNGDWAEVELRMRGLAAREAVLLDLAARQADGTETARLDRLSTAAIAVHQRIESSAPGLPPVRPAADSTAIPTETVPPTHAPSPTPMQTNVPRSSPQPRSTPESAGGHSGDGGSNGTASPSGSATPDAGSRSQPDIPDSPSGNKK